jgi:hypothetical protein
LGKKGYTPEHDRGFFSDIAGEGVMGFEDFRVEERTPNSMGVNVGAGTAYIINDYSINAGTYRVPLDSSTTVGIKAADLVEPRIDQVILRVYDDQYDESGRNEDAIEVLTGIPLSTATLDSRDGAQELPDNAILLADVLVTAGLKKIAAANIRNRRQVAAPWAVPYLQQKLEIVPMLPQKHTMFDDGLFRSSFSNFVWTAAMVYLYKSVEDVNRIMLKYRQHTTAATGTYAFALYDASGHLLFTTGAVALTGGNNSYQLRAEKLAQLQKTSTGQYKYAIPSKKNALSEAAVDLHAGSYYLAFITNITNAGSFFFCGCTLETEWDFNSQPGPMIPNTGLHMGGGVVNDPPDSLGAFTDMHSETTEQLQRVVPFAGIASV